MEDERTLDNEKEDSQVEDTTENNESTDEGEDKDAVIATLTEQNQQLSEEKENYKKGMLAAKQKRTLEKTEKTEKKPDIDTNQVVKKALRKMAENEAIAEILDPDSPSFIPECVDGKNWNQIVSYLPSGADRETKVGVKRALKIAVGAWKADTGYKETEENTDASANISALGDKTGGGTQKGDKPKSTLNIPSKDDISTWFPKKE